jgi:hypothetical protein
MDSDSESDSDSDSNKDEDEDGEEVNNDATPFLPRVHDDAHLASRHHPPGPKYDIDGDVEMTNAAHSTGHDDLSFLDEY